MTYLIGWNGHGKMTRKDMWEWCLEGAPPKEWINQAAEKKLTEKGNYYEYAAVRAAINCDNLILGIYDAITGEVTGCYYMTPSGNHHATNNGKDWYQEKVAYMPIGGYSWYNDSSMAKWLWLEGYEEARLWIDMSGLDDSSRYGLSYDDDPIKRLDRIEENLSYMRRKNARERRETRISDWVHDMAYMPDGFMDWVEEVVFAGRHFAFQDKSEGKKGNRYHCTACGRVVSGAGWKHRHIYTCPLCGSDLMVDKTMNGKEASERATYFYPCKSMKWEDRVAMVTMFVTKRWRETGEKISKTAQRILLIPTDGSKVEFVDCDEIYYNHGSFTWSDRNCYGYRCGAGFMYLPDEGILRGTVYEDMLRPVAAASERGWRLNYDSLMLKNGDLCAGVYEYLIKGGFNRMTMDLVNGRHQDGDICWKGETADEVLKINGQSRARLRKADGGIEYLRWLKAAEVYGYKLSDELISWLAVNIPTTSMNKILYSKLIPRMSVEKIANYIKKQMKLGEPLRNWYYGTRAEGVVQSWMDYLGMAKTLGLDLSRESVYKPQNLMERHDELAGIISVREREKQAKKNAAELKRKAKDMEIKYPGVAPVCAKIKELYEWRNDGYSVVVPSGAWDIMQEGVLLGHCSSREQENVYLERVEKETSYIMFLRKNERKDSPWYTMEVEPGGNVIQLRTYGDDDGKHKYHDRDEAKAALNLWRKDIAKRLGQGEITKAQKSKEMLLSYWDGLKKNGNIIRGGYLKGQLLVDVLKADYQELNGELPMEAAE